MYVSVVAVGYVKRVNQYFMYLCVWVSLVPQSPDPLVAGRLSIGAYPVILSMIGDYNFQSISALRPKGCHSTVFCITTRDGRGQE